MASNSSSFRMGGGFTDFNDDDDDDSDDPLGDYVPFKPFDDDLDDDLNFTIRMIPSDEIICEPSPRQAKVVSKYLIGETLGEGSYGKVKEALNVEKLQRQAVKIMKKRKLRRIPHGEDNVKREICMLKQLSHTNIIRLNDVLYNDAKEKLYIVMEYCVCALNEMLLGAPDHIFPEWQAHFYFKQLINGLEYLHSKGVIHKDLKPSNLLLNTEETLKISDFGVAEQLDPFSGNDLCTTSQGSPAFQPPEIANGVDKFSGTKLDIWACGVSLFNMVTASYPYEGENIYRLFENIGKGVLVIPSHVDQVLKAFLEGLLLTEYEKRFTINDIRNHVWFRKKYYQYEKRVGFPKSEKSDNVSSMTTIPFLQMYNDNDIKFIEDDLCKNQTAMLGKNSSNNDFFHNRRSSSTCCTSVDPSKEKSKRSKFKKYTQGSCKAM